MKKKKATEKQSEGIYVRLTPQEAKKLKQYAKQYKLSMAESLRSAAAEKLFYFQPFKENDVVTSVQSPSNK